MKNYFVIGNPIDHSLSPKLHNHWIRKFDLKARYEKKKLEEKQIKGLITDIRERKIDGVNVTVPFKNKVIPHIDILSPNAKITQSVNTIHLKDNKIIGENTDIEGFQLGIKSARLNITGKKIFILGAGGVVPSIILGLKNMKVSKILVSNRTKSKAENLQKTFNDLDIIDWGETTDFDMVINATSLGLADKDQIDFNFEKIAKNKIFYDVIYNPSETNFLKSAKKHGGITENGKMMFIYQAYLAFKIWHNITPEIDNDLIKFLN